MSKSTSNRALLYWGEVFLKEYDTYKDAYNQIPSDHRYSASMSPEKFEEIRMDPEFFGKYWKIVSYPENDPSNTSTEYFCHLGINYVQPFKLTVQQLKHFDGEPILIHHHHEPPFTLQVLPVSEAPSLDKQGVPHGVHNPLDSIFYNFENFLVWQVAGAPLESSPGLQHQIRDVFIHFIKGFYDKGAYRVLHRDHETGEMVETLEKAKGLIPEGYAEVSTLAFDDWLAPPNQASNDYFEIQVRTNFKWQTVTIYFDHTVFNNNEVDPNEKRSFTVKEEFGDEYGTFDNFETAYKKIPRGYRSVLDPVFDSSQGLNHDSTMINHGPAFQIISHTGEVGESMDEVRYNYYEVPEEEREPYSDEESTTINVYRNGRLILEFDSMEEAHDFIHDGYLFNPSHDPEWLDFATKPTQENWDHYVIQEEGESGKIYEETIYYNNEPFKGYSDALFPIRTVDRKVKVVTNDGETIEGLSFREAMEMIPEGYHTPRDMEQMTGLDENELEQYGHLSRDRFILMVEDFDHEDSGVFKIFFHKFDWVQLG